MPRAKTTYSDDDILAAVRQYAAEHGGALNGEKAWDARRPAALPTGSALCKRFGSMRRAAELAGVPYVPLPPPTGDTTRAALIEAARRYAAAHGSLCGKVLWRQYVQQERAAGRYVPSFASVEHHFGGLTALAAAAGVPFERRKPRPHTVNPRQPKAPPAPRPDRRKQEWVQHHLSRLVRHPPLDDDERERVLRRIDAELAQLQEMAA